MPPITPPGFNTWPGPPPRTPAFAAAFAPPHAMQFLQRRPTVFHRPGFDDEALARVNRWVDEARSMFERAGVPAAEQGPRPRVEFAPGMHNARMDWSSNTMILGEYGPTATPFSRSRDVVAHEYAHKVIATVLVPDAPATPESLAAQESLADTFAAAVDTDDWTMGEDLFTDGRFNRSLDNPAAAAAEPKYGLSELPDHVHEFDHHANIHANAGIGNRAAQRIGQALGRERMASLYVRALRNHLSGPLSFQALADATLAAAGDDARARAAVADAWKAVGIVPPRPR